jgi:hypothetical protein
VGTVNGSITSFSGFATDVVSLGYLCYLDDALRCDGSSGACVALKPVGQGCTDQFAGECVLAARCDSTMQTCVARKALGVTCAGSQDECQAQAYCSGTSRVCTTKVANGMTCTISDECVSGNCDSTTCKAGLDDLGLFFICGSN